MDQNYIMNLYKRLFEDEVITKLQNRLKDLYMNSKYLYEKKDNDTNIKFSEEVQNEIIQIKIKMDEHMKINYPELCNDNN